jgi:hypothetical protein
MIFFRGKPCRGFPSGIWYLRVGLGVNPLVNGVVILTITTLMFGNIPRRQIWITPRPTVETVL